MEGFRCWKPLMSMDDADYRKALADPQLRNEFREELRERALRVFNGEWDKLFVAQVADRSHADWEGRSVAELAAESSADPFDFMLDLALSENLDTLFTATLLNSDEQAVGKLMRDENAILSLSDAGAHLTFLCDAGFGLHVLGHWVRERKQLPIEEAIRKLTTEPAQLFGIRDRGRIEKGYWADMLLFDPATVGRGATRRVHDLPAGASRLTTASQGVHGVWVNGELVADGEGVRANAPRAGQVLREFAG
jgi:N-acyl-D-aspartate/D-glutamate deacylase